MKRVLMIRKTWPLFCLILGLVASLTVFLIRHERYNGNLPGLVERNRNTTQVFVQIISVVLAVAQMVLICSLINFAARIRLFESPTTTGTLSFWSALSAERFDITLPAAKLALLTMLLSTSTVLGALWAGSFTPLFSTASREDGEILVPVFNTPVSRSMYPIWSSGLILTECQHRLPPFDDCIVTNHLGSLLMTVATATNITSPRLHPKLDNNTWSYVGRSYGKGSSSGVFDVTNMTEHAYHQGFSYQESGYKIQASCTKQNHTTFLFKQYSTGGQFNLCRSSSVTLEPGNISAPIDIPPFDIATGAYNYINTAPFGYFAWTAVSRGGVHYIATSAMDWSNRPGNMTCTIDYQPMAFLTNVSTADKIITVTPLKEVSTLDESNIVNLTLSDLDLMSRMTSSSSGLPVLYSTLKTNYDSIASLASNETAHQNAKWEKTLETSLEAVLDDLLMYQGILAVGRDDGESSSQPVVRYFIAIKFGDSKYQIAQLVINVVLCVLYIYEAIRTRYWKHLPDFDFVDVKALMLAALGPERTQQQVTSASSGPLLFAKGRENDVKLVAQYEGSNHGFVMQNLGTTSSRPAPATVHMHLHSAGLMVTSRRVVTAMQCTPMERI